MITYPLNNIDYTAEDAELYFSTRVSGVYDGNDFEVTASGIDNDVTVGTGIAWIHNTKFSGKVVALKEPKTLTLSLPNSVYDRIDAIVIQFDANKNATEIVVKEGIASSAPVPPSVVRTDSLYELHIYHVFRKAGETVIDVDNLVDLRNNSDYCGIMFDQISSIDNTLSKRGFAADAKYTGDAIRSATIGFGLGGVCKSIDSILNISANGWYLSNVDTPYSAWYLCHARVTNNGNDVIVDAWSFGGDYHAIRTKKSGTWGEWEWENPPLGVGTEYRTTERWNSKVVYVKAVSFGSLPNATTTSVTHNIAATNFLRYTGFISDGKALPYCYSNTRVDVGVSATSIHITAASDFSDKTATVVLYYTKD